MGPGTARSRERGGLALRVAVASALLSLLIGGVFALLVGAITGMRDAALLARHSDQVLTAANDLERIVIDLETGERGYLLTKDEEFLQPWTAARGAFEGRAAELRRLTAVHHAGQARRAHQIVNAGRAYIREYSDPVIRAARGDIGAERNITISLDGKQRVDRMRSEFRELIGFEQRLAAEREARSDAAAHRAVLVAIGGTGASLLLIIAFGGHFTRGVVQPIRRTARMAGEVARGNLGVRMPETGTAEIGRLERSFNSMANSLQRNRDELTASRARVIAAGDATRRRIERDLHDGTQQRLVTLSLELRTAGDEVPSGHETLRRRLEWSVHETNDVIRELREFSRGIHPAMLARGGLGPALNTLARRSPVPVDLHVDIGRRPGEPVEVGVYYVVSEALTNAAKHAKASALSIDLTTDADDVRLVIRDDGVGGADPERGSGLIGLRDRVEALGGEITVRSPANAGTTLLVRMPAAPP
jgi:signal transduction histidine kinase